VTLFKSFPKSSKSDLDKNSINPYQNPPQTYNQFSLGIFSKKSTQKRFTLKTTHDSQKISDARLSDPIDYWHFKKYPVYHLLLITIKFISLEKYY
jgi:hypothetical protein